MPSQSEIVTLAVYLLGGAQKFIDTEDVAVKVHEIAPGRFSWRKYPAQINLELVRVYLSDAKKADKGSMLTGSGRKGWSLTSKGHRWVEKNIHLLEQDLTLPENSARSGSVDTVRADRELKRVQTTTAWRNWQEREETITPSQAKEVFRIDSYTKKDMLPLKIDRLLNLLAHSAELSEFLGQMAKIIQEEETS